MKLCISKALIEYFKHFQFIFTAEFNKIIIYIIGSFINEMT